MPAEERDATLASSSVSRVASGPPAIPPIQSVNEIGIVRQHPLINGRDGTYSAVIQGKSVWAFNDTPLKVPGVGGDSWVDNSIAWTTDFNASDGIYLDNDQLDRTGAPAEFMPYTKEEKQYNKLHDDDNCQAQPCGAEYALWPAMVVPDPARNRALFFYNEVYRVFGQADFEVIGGGISVYDYRKFKRPIASPGSDFPTLMWREPQELAHTSGWVVKNDSLYTYGCATDFLAKNCKVARVHLADALNKSAWRYYATNGTWTSNQALSATVFNGGAAGNSIFYSDYLGMYVVIYSQVFSDDVYYRVSNTPWGPWSDQRFLFRARAGWQGNAGYAALAHPEFAEENGRIQYVTYVRTTGFLQFELPLVRVVFGAPRRDVQADMPLAAAE